MTMTVEALPQTAPVRVVTMNLLRDLGMTTMFGNPGSTELRFLKDWPEDFTYVMGLHEGASVATGDGVFEILEIQPESKRRVSARDFVSGARIKLGDRFDVPPPAAQPA